MELEEEKVAENTKGGQERMVKRSRNVSGRGARWGALFTQRDTP